MKGDCKSKKTYVEIVENVAVRGVAVAEAYLGDFYLKGEYVKKDPARAVELLTRAAEKKSAFAMYKHGECYGSGVGVEKDGEKSASLVLDAAQLKFVPAMVDVGRSLVHRDYTIYGSEVLVDIYPDRLEIVSPGGMPDGSSVQDLDWRSVALDRRNPTLADMFVQ